MLEAPAVQLLVPMEEISDTVAKEVKKRGWREYEIVSLQLVYVPVWLVTFTAFFSQDKVVIEETGGGVGINAADGSLIEHASYVVSEGIAKLERSPTHGLKFETLPQNVGREEAKEIARVKLAAKLKIPQENVKTFGSKLVYYPQWWVNVKVGGQTYKLVVDGVTGQVFGAEQIPKREPTPWEVGAQVLADLKNPKNWAKYFSLTVKTLFKVLSGKEKGDLAYWLVVGILILVLILMII